MAVTKRLEAHALSANKGCRGGAGAIAKLDWNHPKWFTVESYIKLFQVEVLKLAK